MIHNFIRLAVVELSSDSCQTKVQQLPDESSTTVRRKFNNCQTNKFMYDEY